MLHPMCFCQIMMLFWIKYKLTQPISFVSKSANSESMHGVQSDPTQYDLAVKYVGAMRVKVLKSKGYFLEISNHEH